MTTPIRTLNVKPRIPNALQDLKDLSENLWFAWNHDAEDLFRRINPDLWKETRKNPVELLSRLKQQELENLAGDEGFLGHLGRVKKEFDRYMSEKLNPEVFGEDGRRFQVAYFTAECGVEDCLHMYSGGLGILAGDLLKSGSDLNLPIIGVSLAYQKGYFRQYLTQEGSQMETYPVYQFANMPIKRVRDQKGNVIKVRLNLKGENVHVQAWQVAIGRTELYLLDTNLKENSEWARNTTAQLYGGDREMRIRQEIVLGIGGVRMLETIGFRPAVYHMNEGHSAFTIFERIRRLRQDDGFSFDEALEFVKVTSAFTTHTPVSAGIDMFHPDLMRSYFEHFAKAMGISFDVLMGFGRMDPKNRNEAFSMAVLTLRISNWNNGVSRLHARVSRKMWRNIWPNTPETDLPIIHITNGVHIPSFLSSGMAENYHRYLGPRWIEDPDNVKVWERIDKIPDMELWRTHERARARLVAFSRDRLRAQLERRGSSDRDMAFADEILNPEALTICFARRFVPYKRALLIVKDIQRLERILTNEDCPVQIIVAGKAHPLDHMGKDMIRQLFQVTMKGKLKRHMVFLEDYDMEVSRYMVQGADIWLNTPRRPMEACGTSGMKAVANGALHLSILDGWWDEGYEKEIGWAIGRGEEYDDHEFQDELDSKKLYDILEKDIIPLFYERGSDDLPRGWLAMMKASLHRLCPVFNSHRMVEEYWTRFYVPAAKRHFQLMDNEAECLKKLVEWRQKIMYNWQNVTIKDIRLEKVDEILVGDHYQVEADLLLGGLLPEDLMVEAYYGRVDPSRRFIDSLTQVLHTNGPSAEGFYRYQGDIGFSEVGHFGLNIRVTPNHPNAESRHAMGLVIWGRD